MGWKPTPGVIVVATAHPSVDAAVRQFCASLRAETRYFGRRGAEAPKPPPSLVRRLESDEPAIGLAAYVTGAIVGVARIDDRESDGPELMLAVAAPWRGRGVALALGREIVTRAHHAGIARLVVRRSYRGADGREIGESLGWEVVRLGRGRLELIATLPPASQSA